MFHQVEGMVIDKGVTMADLKGTLNTVVEQLYGKGTKTRFRPHHFPFTEPSCEMDVQCHKCGGVGCPTCKGEGWIELLGAGMIHPRVLEMAGIDPSVYSGWAFGIGLERTAMRRFKIADLRLIFENDVRFWSSSEAQPQNRRGGYQPPARFQIRAWRADNIRPYTRNPSEVKQE